MSVSVKATAYPIPKMERVPVRLFNIYERKASCLRTATLGNRPGHPCTRREPIICQSNLRRLPFKCRTGICLSTFTLLSPQKRCYWFAVCVSCVEMSSGPSIEDTRQLFLQYVAFCTNDYCNHSGQYLSSSTPFGHQTNLVSSGLQYRSQSISLNPACVHAIIHPSCVPDHITQ